MSVADIPVHLIDSEDSLRTCLVKLQSCLRNGEYFYLDIEGHKLGRYGTLDLIQLYVPALREIFVIDVLVLGRCAFTTSSDGISLQKLLNDPTPTKVFFDVRDDSDALFSHFGITLQGVVDLQLMEYFQPGRMGINLLGLQACILQHSRLHPRILQNWTGVKQTVTASINNIPAIDSLPPSQQRPLPPIFLDYAAGDVRYMPLLFTKYGKCLSEQIWNVIKVESLGRVTCSQKPQYDPHAKNKWKGPFRRPLGAAMRARTLRSSNKNVLAADESSITERMQVSNLRGGTGNDPCHEHVEDDVTDALCGLVIT